MLSPLPSLFMLAGDALSRHDRFGAPSEWRSAIRSTLSAADRAALAPVLESNNLWPDCVVPPPGRGEVSVGESLERIADTPRDMLLSELDELGLADDEAWRTVVRNARRWLHEYVRALARAWHAVEPLWSGAAALRDREIERVGLAAVRGTLPELLGGLHPRAWVCDGLWHFPPCEPRRLRVADAGLVIVPMLAGPRASLRYDAGGAFSHLAYPMPGIDRLLDANAPPDPALEALLGASRAAMLRLLDRPVTSGELAAVLLAGPSTASHHLRALEGAGLVERERDGRRVLVRRTARGTALLELYDLTA